MRYFLALLLCAACFGAHAAEPARTVSVSATGKVEAAPDRAVLPITLETQDKSLNAAKQANDRLMAKFLAVAKQFELAKEKLTTTGIYVNPRYRWEDKTHKQVLEGYGVSRSIQVNIDDLGKLEPVLAALTEAGIDQVQGVQFTLANPDALEASARKQAMEKASAKAAELAAGAGAKLGPVMSITESGGGFQPPMPMQRAMAMKAEADVAPPPPLPGLMQVEQSVSVTYALQ